MKKILLGSFFLFSFMFSGCGGTPQNELSREKPEIAPICPEGFYWVDTIKSCTLILEE
jgi:lipoprotein